MKKFHLHFRLIAVVLSICFLFQNCKVYHSKTSSVNNIVNTENRVKITMLNSETYIFQKLIKMNNQLIGITNRNSDVAKDLNNQIIGDYTNDKYVKILLDESKIQHIQAQNKSLSTVLTIAIPLVIIIGVSIIAANSVSPTLNWGETH